ncbi:MAG: DNA gyrase subunit A, partial [Pseudomonadota bacterium]
SAVYDTIVRMAQPFAMRYMLVDGQGNFGSVDGDRAAAMRYTEIRMSRLAHELLRDLDRETVDFAPNYDETESEPVVLPTRVPNLLVNGSAGIAVGMATNIPPHNLTEVVSATLALIDSPELDVDQLMEHMPGPDSPTAGIINGAAGIREAYRTGRGRIYVRARTEIETDERNGKQTIIVSELPYQVNKARLIEKIALLVKEKKLEGITNLRDESDKDGMRMVIELRRGEVADVVLNNLYQQTQMQSVFGINMVALLDGQPRLLTLKQVLEAFISHRREVVTRRTLYDLRKARDRAHVLEGLTVALANIDEIIAVIKASPGPKEAREALQSRRWEPGVVASLLSRAGAEASRPENLDLSLGLTDEGYQLSEVQAQSILDLRLNRLTGLEQDKLVAEYEEILDAIAELLAILSDPDKLMAVIREELEDLREKFGDERRTVINERHTGLSLEDLISEEDVVVTLSHAGYAKAQPLDAYRAQRRGGRGRSATSMKDEDFVDKLFVANTHDTLLCFTSNGKVYWIKVFELPQASRAARGKPIVNLLPLAEGERVNAVLPVREFLDSEYVFFAARSGYVKKTPLSAFSRPRANGIIAIDLPQDDELIDVAITNGEHHILLFSSAGKAIRFDESDVRSMGRTARGVIGLRLADDATLVSMIVADGRAILTATQNGFGKRTALEEFPSHRRGGQGVIAVQTNNRNGDCVGAVQVCDDDEVLLISYAGTLVRTRVEVISVQGRNTQGVTLIRLGDEEDLVGIAPIESMEDEDGENDLEDAGQNDDGDEAGPSDPEPGPDAESDPEPDA